MKNERLIFLDLGNDNYQRVDKNGQPITTGRQKPNGFLDAYDLESRMWIERLEETPRVYKVRHYETGEERNFSSTQELLNFINEDRSAEWADYDENDWEEGLQQLTDHDLVVGFNIAYEFADSEIRYFISNLDNSGREDRTQYYRNRREVDAVFEEMKEDNYDMHLHSALVSFDEFGDVIEEHTSEVLDAYIDSEDDRVDHDADGNLKP